MQTPVQQKQDRKRMQLCLWLFYSHTFILHFSIPHAHLLIYLKGKEAIRSVP